MAKLLGEMKAAKFRRCSELDRYIKRTIHRHYVENEGYGALKEEDFRCSGQLDDINLRYGVLKYTSIPDIEWHLRDPYLAGFHHLPYPEPQTTVCGSFKTKSTLRAQSTPRLYAFDDSKFPKVNDDWYPFEQSIRKLCQNIQTSDVIVDFFNFMTPNLYSAYSMPKTLKKHFVCRHFRTGMNLDGNEPSQFGIVVENESVCINYVQTLIQCCDFERPLCVKFDWNDRTKSRQCWLDVRLRVEMATLLIYSYLPSDVVRFIFKEVKAKTAGESAELFLLGAFPHLRR